jgi:ABC-2 type transport system ATP-binding protein
MSADSKDVLARLTKKELVEIANTKNIRLPTHWSRSLIVELLALNVSIDTIQKIMTQPLERKIVSDGVPAIIIKNLVKTFEDVTAVDDVSLEIMEGELFSLLGPNGAGKTTTINILNGIMKPTSGTAVISGFDVTTNLDDIKKMIGFCPQEASVYKFLTARENIQLFGNLHSVSKKELEERTDALLELFGLTDAGNRKTGGYSGGMLRKLNLMIALISDPTIAFLDEPTVGMDARARRKTWEFIGSLKQENKTVILTTHYIEEAEALSDRVGILDYGKLVELGSPDELMGRYDAENLEDVFLTITGRRIAEGL